jgi:hypothetical protein
MNDVRPFFKFLRAIIFVVAVVFVPLTFLMMAFGEGELPIWMRVILGVFSIPAVVISLELMKVLKWKTGDERKD